MNDRKPPEFAGKDDANLTPYLLELLEGNTLSEKDASSAFEMIMTGDAHHAEVGALLALLATLGPGALPGAMPCIGRRRRPPEGIARGVWGGGAVQLFVMAQGPGPYGPMGPIGP